MKVGQTVQFKLTNNPETLYNATVFSIGSSFENESKTISVHANVTGNKVGLIDGMNVTGMVSLGNSSTAAVPNEAIVEADGKFYVFVQTSKKPEEHAEEKKEGEQEEATKETGAHTKDQGKTLNFEKIEIVKGSSDLGYTAITTVTKIAPDTNIVVKGAFFVNAKLSNAGGHED